MASETLIIALIALTGVAMITFMLLRGWQDWLRLKERELDSYSDRPGVTAGGAGRIELADLRERIRKLEAIAAGVDL